MMGDNQMPGPSRAMLNNQWNGNSQYSSVRANSFGTGLIANLDFGKYGAELK